MLTTDSGVSQRPPFSPEFFYTAAEVCAALRISRQTLWRMERRRDLIPRRLGMGRTLRYLGSDLIRMVDGGER
jgi:predicted DNA-binding transcriptional regulator AlpA